MKRIFISISVALIIYGFNSYLSGRNHHPEMVTVKTDTGYKSNLIYDTVRSPGSNLPKNADKNFMMKKIGDLQSAIASVVTSLTLQ